MFDGCRSSLPWSPTFSKSAARAHSREVRSLLAFEMVARKVLTPVRLLSATTFARLDFASCMLCTGSHKYMYGSVRLNFVTAVFTPTAGICFQNLGFEIVHLGPLATLLSVCFFGAREFHRALVRTVEAAWHRCKGTFGDVASVLWESHGNTSSSLPPNKFPQFVFQSYG